MQLKKYIGFSPHALRAYRSLAPGTPGGLLLKKFWFELDIITSYNYILNRR